ncbi:hypothetical protein OESDEN_12485 [Oesophagostomum dentatum]|uniref:Uncharacterized protein n=1 Tax=Oesophagostomum dentatum TaxID=61180 RepID=A0A0B1SR09_OESDE|nr:hypothetical protein OESDEN_12485 [Oesophagostomum dentatum]
MHQKRASRTPRSRRPVVAKTLLKSIEYLDYPEFLDKHFQKIEPGVSQPHA